MNKLKKWIVKCFMPSADTMAEMVAGAAADFVNKSDKEQEIAKWSTLADNWTKIQAKLTGWLKDGRMDAAETEELKRAILPICKKIEEAVR